MDSLVHALQAIVVQPEEHEQISAETTVDEAPSTTENNFIKGQILDDQASGTISNSWSSPELTSGKRLGLPTAASEPVIGRPNQQQAELSTTHLTDTP